MPSNKESIHALILFLRNLTQFSQKDQLIWVFCLSKINKNDRDIIPAHEILYKTNTKLHQLKEIIRIGNEKLQSIGFPYTFIVEGESIEINKISIPKPEKKVRHSKAELLKSENEKFQSIINEVIDYLNQSAGTQYPTDKKVYNDIIIERINEGFIIEQFRHVIQVKCNHWLRNPKMQPYLTPLTLFGEKMEVYIDEQIVVRQSNARTNYNAAQQAKQQGQNKSNIFPANPTEGN